VIFRGIALTIQYHIDSTVIDRKEKYNTGTINKKNEGGSIQIFNNEFSEIVRIKYPIV